MYSAGDCGTCVIGTYVYVCMYVCVCVCCNVYISRATPKCDQTSTFTHNTHTQVAVVDESEGRVCIFPLIRAACSDEQVLAALSCLPDIGPFTLRKEATITVPTTTKKVKEKSIEKPQPKAETRRDDDDQGSTSYARFFGSTRTAVLPACTDTDTEAASNEGNGGDGGGAHVRPRHEIGRVRNVNREVFERITGRGEPVVLEGINWGSCVHEWTPQSVLTPACSFSSELYYIPVIF
jgi:hypothetical protein